MKHLVLSISIFFSINCFAQEPNPDLFRTWYLGYVMASDGGQPYKVSEIEATAIPSLTITENLDFNGVGVCNSFNGKFTLYDNTICTSQYSNSSDDCGIEIHNSFEQEYFDFMKYACGYSIGSNGDNLFLYLNTPFFGMAVFESANLNTLQFNLNQIEVFPNPSNSIIHLNAQNTTIFKIELYNSLGQNIKTLKNNFETIEISDLTDGIYIMKIFTEFGTLNKKILKN